MASVVPAHVTVTYPEETADETVLLRRAEACLAGTKPFRLGLGEIFAEDAGRGGVFVAVHDVDEGWAGMRQQLLAEAASPIDFPAHITVAHPRTSARGEECYAALAGQRLAAEVWVREVLFTQTGNGTFTVLRRFPLAAGAPRRGPGLPAGECRGGT
jgi:hypothetical protein